MLERVLGMSVPGWFVAALVLFFALGTVAFSWYVKRSIYLSDGSPIAQAAIAVASFPTRVKQVFLALRDAATGEASYTHVRAVAPKREVSDFSPVGSQLKTAVEGLMIRQGPGSPARGWRILVGGFKIDGSVEDAAVLLSPDLEIAHYWLLAEEGLVNSDPEPPSYDLTHGFVVLEDGSVIYNFYGEEGIRKKDSCGRTEWVVPGNYHHSVALGDSDGTVWTLRDDSANGDPAEGNKIVQMAIDDGKVRREFSIADIVAANPDTDILELRRIHEDEARQNTAARPGQWLRDPFHLNDADPLPQSLASQFPLFSAGDLMISARELNLIFVIDPGTLAIKWWRVGATIRQHDPDWTADGRVSVFNNRMARGYSEIVEIDPATFAKTVAVSGRDIGFYSRGGGKHQPIPGGGWLIASGWQGHIIELNAEGDIALELYAIVNDEGPLTGRMSEVIFLPEEALDIGAFQCGQV